MVKIYNQNYIDRDRIKKKIINPIYDEVKNQVNMELIDHVRNQLNIQISDKVYSDKVYNQTRDQVWDQVWFKINSATRNKPKINL